MPKYTERNVVVIKRDIEKFSNELVCIIGDIDKAKKEYKEILDTIERERGQLDRVIESKNTKLTQLAEEVRKLHEEKAQTLKEIEGYGSEKFSLKRKIGLLTDLLNEAVGELSELPNTIFVDDLIRESKRVLEGVQKETFAEKEKLRHAQVNAASEQAALVALSEEKEILIKKITTLRTGEVVKKDELSRLQNELSRVEGRIETIEKRETDVRIMEERLTPEYKDFYKSVRLQIKHLNTHGI